MGLRSQHRQPGGPGEAKLVLMDVASYEQQQETNRAVELLALGKREMKKGSFRAAPDVFADLDKEDGVQVLGGNGHSPRRA